MATRTLNVQITGDASSLNRVLGQSESRLGKFAKMGGIAGAALTTGLGLAVKAAANFEAQLDSLGAVSGASAKQMERLKKQAMDAGKATKFSALEAAQAQTELAKGGLSLDKILSGGLNSSLALAAAGEMDLAEAAATTANALNLFNLEGKQAGHVADALATAANSTTADVSDFALALTQGGAAAKAAGLDLDETVVALEALANAGVKGSDAGTSLKAMLAQLAAPVPRQRELMKKLNIEFFDQQGNMKSLADISELLRKRIGGLTKEQQLHHVKTLAGTDGMRAMLALFDAGPAKIEKLGKELEKQGTAADVAAKKQDNLKGKLENFMGSVETLGISIGGKLIPALTGAAEAATGFVNGMQTGEGVGGRVVAVVGGITNAMGGLISGFQSGAEGARGLAAALGAAIAAFAAFRILTGVAAAITAVKTAFEALTVAMAKNPAGAAAVALAAVAGALGVLSIRTSTATASTRDLNDALRAQADALRAVRDIDIDVAQREANLKSATVGVEQAERRLKDVRKDGNATALDIKQAEADLKQARVAAKRAQRDLGDAEVDAKRKREDATAATQKAEQEHRKYIAGLREQIKQTEKEISAADSSAIAYQSVGAKVQGAGEKADAARARAKRLREELARLKSKELTVTVRLDFNAAINASPGGDAAQGDGEGVGLTRRVISGVKANASRLFTQALPSMGGSFGAGGLMGADSDLGLFAGIGSRFGLGVSSGLRPGAVTSSGNQSYHATGDAIDESGSPSGMLGYFNFIKNAFGSRLRELIYTPGGVGIKDGRPFRYTGKVAADHYDHVHVAYTGPFGDGIGDAARSAAKYWRGNDLITAVAVAGPESGYRDNARLVSSVEDSRGMWQVNTRAHPWARGLNLADTDTAARAAHRVWAQAGGSWGPWSGFTGGGYKGFLSRARAAVAGLSGGGAPGAGGGAGGAAGFARSQRAGRRGERAAARRARPNVGGFRPPRAPGPTRGTPGFGGFGDPILTPDNTDPWVWNEAGRPDAGGADSAQEEANQLAAALVEQLKALTDETKRQNDIHASVVAVAGREAIRAFADVISGQIVGVGLQGRRQTAGTGAGVLIP